MKKTRTTLIGASLSIAALTGCATTATTSAPAPLAAAASYQDVYLIKPTQDPRNVFPRLVREFQEMGFRVHPVDENRFLGKAEGNGFLVSRDGHLITAAHALEGQKTATVWLDGKRHEADLVDQDADKDLALIKLRTAVASDLAPLNLSQDPQLALGRKVYAVGHTPGSSHRDGARLSQGLVSRLAALSSGHAGLEITTGELTATSGAPLLTDQGTVVGMMQRVKTADASRAHYSKLAISSPMIAAYVNDAQPGTLDSDNAHRSGSIEQAARAVAKVQPGLVEADKPKQPRLVATVDYRSVQEKWPRFKDFELVMRDLDSGEVVLATSSSANSVSRPEETVISGALSEVRTAFNKN